MKQLLWRSMKEGIALEIIYMNKSGELSQRKIKVIDINQEYIKAYCFMRKSKRTFNFNNILSVDIIRRRMGA